jgi:glyoxylase-like metal-dependent hydrolase (beta-lactamase superfamily II)
MRVLALHRDVVVATSRFWQTTCTLVRNGDEAFVIDSPVLPDELDLLPTVAEQAGFNVVGLLATHGDWDHVLGSYAFGDGPLGIAESTAERFRADPGDAQRELREFDDEHYVVRPRPLSLSGWQELPVPGRCELGDGELELHPVRGHGPDGMVIDVPWAKTLVVGDHLSPVEIPWLADIPDALASYLETLERLEPLVERADWIVPGHGEPLDAERALAILREDRAYLEALRDVGAAAPLPLARRTGAQKKIHAANVGIAA